MLILKFFDQIDRIDPKHNNAMILIAALLK
jgi:hypothetical protein